MRLFRRKKNKPLPRSLAEQFPDLSLSTLSIIERALPYTMTSPERISALCDAVGYVQKCRIPGAIVECGVWRGGSVFAAVEALLENGGQEREFWLYDTFEGMTEPTKEDIDFLGHTAEELLTLADKADEKSVWCCSQLQQVQQLLFSSSYPRDKFRFVVGDVESTLPAQMPEQIALLRLDTDWYESTKQELTHLLPRLSLGGVLIVDDYGHWNGCRRAVDEFFEAWSVPMLLNRIDYTGRIGVLQRPFDGSTNGRTELSEVTDGCL